MSGGTNKGRFISFEGGEGVGKSTQVRLLQAQLANLGIAAVQTREPGGSPRAEAIRRMLLAGSVKQFGQTAEALMFSAARIDHLNNTIRPALAAGTWVICDRFADSTRAYQGALRQIEPQLIDALERVAVGNTRPELTFILDLAPAEGLRRAALRAGPDAPVDRFERETLAFHSAVRNIFLDIAAHDPVRCAVIDASLAPEYVAARIWASVKLRLLGSAGQQPAGHNAATGSAA